jgi:mycothiol synthase
MKNSTKPVVPPALAGLIWRPVDSADLAALVSLADACFRADGGLDFLFEPDSLKNIFFPDSPAPGIGAFAANGQMVACAAVHLGGEALTRRAIMSGYVHPELRKRRLGSFLMRWSQDQARVLLGASSADQRCLQIRTESLSEPANRLYLAHGFKPVFEELVMRRELAPLPDPRLPADVSLTTWQPELAAQFFQAYNAAFRERPGFPAWTAAEWVDSWTDEHSRPDWSLLASIDDTPVGFLTASSNHPDGFVVQVGVIPAQRRRGLGSGLIIESMRRMLADGAAAVQLVVNANNPGALQAYLGLGFVEVGRRARYEKRME